MEFFEIEHMFNRALKHAFSKKKCLFVFPILAVCGLLVVFCRALSYGASKWVVLSLTFLPVFLCFGILLALGVFLIRIYSEELKGGSLSYGKVLFSSWELLLGVSYLSLPLLLTYLILWVVLGIFYLLREIPGVGETLGVLLSFGPFLLVLGSLVLSVANFFFLFFASPHLALQKGHRWETLQRVFSLLKKHIFSNFLLFLLGLMPLLLFFGILSLAAVLTESSYLSPNQTIALTFEWFFIMLPFCALLTPMVIFFFNFGAESFALIERKEA